MKKIITLAIGLLLTVGSITAQNRGGARRMDPKERVEMLKKELKLSDEQTEKITALYDEFGKKMSNADRNNRQQMRSEMDSLSKNIEKILNDDQKQAFKKLQESRNHRQRGGRRDHR